MMSQLDELVIARIDRERPTRFASTPLAFVDAPYLLQIVLSSDPSFPSLDLNKCIKMLSDWRLHKALGDAYELRSFSNLMKHSAILELKDPNQSTVNEATSRERPGNVISTLQAAFEESYQGNMCEYFIRVLNTDFRNYDPYNRAFSIINSSGMGKSRLVHEVAKKVFTIPANLREELPEGTKAYPPPDEQLRSFFDNHEHKSDILLQAEYAILLKNVFDTVTAMLPGGTRPLKELVGRQGGGLAKGWAEYLYSGQDEDSVGENRLAFYKAALETTTSEIAEISELVVADTAGRCLDLRKTKRIDKIFRNMTSSGLMLAIYGFRTRSPYHNLDTVLAELSNLPLYFMFLSTDSRLRQLAPPSSHPAPPLAPRGKELIPPFTELPLDVFMKQMFRDYPESERSLAWACTTDVMSSFGRPLWYVHHKQWVDQERPGTEQRRSHKALHHVLRLAYQKLTASVGPYNIQLSLSPSEYADIALSELAVLSVRIGVTFESTTQASRKVESQQVKSRMRVVFAIPGHREYMRTGSPSEPVLAEAAARYLGTGIATAGPRILMDNLEMGFIARGERGELCGRLLMTIAHDVAVDETSYRGLRDARVEFHRPVLVLDFLRALFEKRHHDTILKATPITDKEGKTLEDAFKDAYVCFSHFALAGDSEMLEASALRMALFRGMALHGKEGQFSVDAVIPIHLGSINDPIKTTTTSAINLQFKNRKRSSPCSVDRTVTVPNLDVPVISIVLELGQELPESLSEKKTKGLVQVHHRDRSVAEPEDLESARQDDTHYSFVARGCRHETYNAVCKDAERSYRRILASNNLKSDFPRRNEAAKAVLEEMRPYFLAGKCDDVWKETPGLSSLPDAEGNLKGSGIKRSESDPGTSGTTGKRHKSTRVDE